MMTEAEHTIIVGVTGGGKTTLAEGLTKHCRRIIVLTTKPKAKCFTKGYHEARKSVDVLKYIKRNWNSKKGFRIVWRVFSEPGDNNKQIKALDWICRNLWKWQQGYADEKDNRQIVLNVDEVQRFFPHSEAQKGHAFTWAVSEGRDWGINLLVGTQRPVNIHPIFRDNITNFYSLRLSGDATFKKVNENVGGDHMARLKAIKQFHYAYFRDKAYIATNNTRKPTINRAFP
ncbi:hypothetical protein [Kordiimonas aquimaris]|uniref:hypothetical protein n=1 Tax=Kordiimonas aquimaris TaxID=707591 RepID=UPI0021D05E07|nr:hypothetical protein [Kordiimonas aquimaris]